MTVSIVCRSFPRTDATKRALATVGNCFCLGLYDKEQNGVTAKKAPPNSFILYDPMERRSRKTYPPKGFAADFGNSFKLQACPASLKLSACAIRRD